MRRYRKLFTPLLLVLALSLPLAACGKSDKPSPSAQPTNLTKVRFLSDFIANGVLSPLWYGKAHGYYAAQGIDLQITYGTGSSTTVQTVGNDKADIGDAFSGNIALGVASGAPLQAFGFFRANGAFSFFCDKKFNVTSYAQLAGHSVIIPPGTVQAALYPGVLKAAGLAKGAITVDSIASATAGSSYAGGQSDCIVGTVGDAPTFQTRRPSTILSWSSGGFAVPGFAFFATKDYISAHHQLVAGFLKATYQSIAESLTKSTDAVSAFTAANPQSNPQLVAAQWTASLGVFCTTEMAAAGSPIGYQLPAAWTTIVSEMQQYDNLASSVDAKNLYTNEFFDSGGVSTQKCTASNTL
jgi:NitT/TauT family transport system substrate-binding protein